MQIKYPYLLLLLFSLYTLLLTIKINGEKLRRPISFSDFMSALGTRLQGAVVHKISFCISLQYPDGQDIVYILFSSNHNIHKSSFGLCFWASDPLIERY